MIDIPIPRLDIPVSLGSPKRHAIPASSPELILPRPVDLSDPSERLLLSASAIREFQRIIKEWNVSDEKALGLLGGVTSSTYHAWREKPQGRKLDQDTLTRISLLIGIYRALLDYFGKHLSCKWMTSGNRHPLFENTPPVDFALREGIPGLIQLRSLIEGWTAGH